MVIRLGQCGCWDEGAACSRSAGSRALSRACAALSDSPPHSPALRLLPLQKLPFEGIPTVPPRKDRSHMVRGRRRESSAGLWGARPRDP
jgi:hypothetical protein